MMAGFVINDPEHSPFGLAWLKGVTPARLGLVAALCIASAGQPIANAVAKPDATFWPMASLLLQWALVFFVAALPMFVLVVVAERRTQQSRAPTRIATLAAAVVAGSAIFGAAVWAYYVMQGVQGRTLDLAGYAFFFRSLIPGALLAAVLFFASRQREAERELHRSRMDRLRNEHQIAEARLQFLHTQIEPHFLFNSLANVKRLYETEPGEGRALLGHVRRYFGIAIPAWRQQEVRLDTELALAQAYLSIFRARMAERLRVRVDVPSELDSATIPPLMLGTLIENSLKHGIGPRGSGGTVAISARRQDEMLCLDVADDGLGFHGEAGSGVGLSNIRARLQTLFGDGASLELARNSDGGVTASLRVPLKAIA